jgi:hypothetical protein
MKRPHAEEILGEWGVRDVTPPNQRERALLEADRDLNPLPYMQRLRTIEAETAEHVEELARAYAEHGSDPEAWRRVAETWDFGAVNGLIERHNRWFPLEARLPMDPRSRDFVKIGGKPYRRDPLDTAWVLAQFPA